MMSINKRFRIIQLITGCHYIHHFYYSFGFKIPFTGIGYFPLYGFKKIAIPNLRDKNGNKIKPYHNCTWSGRY